jgi:vacuolar iron transporter family protein
MGLGAYLAAVTDRDHYVAEEKREMFEVETRPEDEKAEIHDILGKYGIGPDACRLVVQDLECNPESWVQVRAERQALPRLYLQTEQFMMDFELKLEKPNVSRAWISAGTMGAAYFIGMRPIDALPD